METSLAMNINNAAVQHFLGKSIWMLSKFWQTQPSTHMDLIDYYMMTIGSILWGLGLPKSASNFIIAVECTVDSLRPQTSNSSSGLSEEI